MIVRLRKFAGNAMPLLRDYNRVRHAYKFSFSRPARIFRPKTFSEKVQWRKLFERDPRMPMRADKIEVKDFVSQILGPEWITPTLWAGDKLPESSARNWPIPFVIKASHGSKMNLFVRSPEEPTWSEIEASAAKWLSETYYGRWSAEWLYSQIKPRLLIEPFINSIAALPIDYKFWTFNGRVEFIQVDTDREKAHKRTMFDRDWKALPFTIATSPDTREIEKPKSLDRMIEAAEVLSEKISFVRVDLYEIDGHPRFGEMTYYPESGLAQFYPARFDLEIGDMWSMRLRL